MEQLDEYPLGNSFSLGKESDELFLIRTSNLSNLPMDFSESTYCKPLQTLMKPLMGLGNVKQKFRFRERITHVVFGNFNQTKWVLDRGSNG